MFTFYECFCTLLLCTTNKITNMPTLTVRLPDKTLYEVEINSKILHVSKNAYIQEAINNLNEKIKSNLKREKLIKASQKVRNNSMEVNSEFSIIENDPEI